MVVVIDGCVLVYMCREDMCSGGLLHSGQGVRKGAGRHLVSGSVGVHGRVI